MSKTFVEIGAMGISVKVKFADDCLYDVKFPYELPSVPRQGEFILGYYQGKYLEYEIQKVVYCYEANVIIVVKP